VHQRGHKARGFYGFGRIGSASREMTFYAKP
jgi:hypothetical protein